MLEGPLDLGLLVGCALSIVILVIVVIWMTVVFVKKRRSVGHTVQFRSVAEGIENRFEAMWIALISACWVTDHSEKFLVKGQG